MNDRLTRVRKGITPIIAIVLLLMMTVAAAGGAYAWLTQLQDQFQERANENLNRDISVIDMTCYNNDTAGYVEVFFKNAGSAELDLNPIDMNIRSRATGDVNFTLTRSSFTLDYDDDANEPAADRVTRPGGPEQDFEAPGDSAAYKIAIGEQSADFETGSQYTVEFIFTDEDDTTKSQSCQADER